MKIAVTYENGQVFQHFGHTEQFKIYDIAENQVVSTSLVDTEGSGHGALGEMLKGIGVDTLICGGIGQGAKNMLSDAGIRLYGGASGKADKVVADLLNGKLEFNPEVSCSHHEESHGGDVCGHHGC